MNITVDTERFSISITEATSDDLERIAHALQHWRGIGRLCDEGDGPTCASCQLLYAIRAQTRKPSHIFSQRS